MTISKQKTELFFRLSISLTVFGALFKILSWPLILLGATGMILFHSIQLYQKKKRLPLDIMRHVLIVTFSCNYLFSILSLPYVHILTSLTRAALIVFILTYVKEILFPSKESTKDRVTLLDFNSERLSHLLADLATVYIVIASLLKILHWQFGIINANLLLIIGLFTALISILAGSKKVAR
jgi:hypothetical protein